MGSTYPSSKGISGLRVGFKESGLIDQGIDQGAGAYLPEVDLARLETLLDALGQGLADELEALLTRAEVRAVRARTEALLRSRRHPVPQPGWPAIPWPAL